MVIKIKVALLCSAMGVSKHYKGGPSIHSYTTHKALDAIGIENQVYYVIPDVDKYYIDENCHHIPGGVVLGSKERASLAEKYVIEEDDYDIYHVLNSDQLAKQCNEGGIEPILGSNLIPNSPPNHCLKYLSQAELEMRRSQIIQEQNLIKSLKYSRWLYQSKFQLSEYQRLGMCDISKTCQGNNGIDTELFKPFDEYEDFVIWSGRNWWPKQPDILKKIAKELPEQEFRLLTDDFLGINLPNVRILMGLSHYHVAEKLNGLMFLSTSVTENQSLAQLEAMSCGLPVIAANSSGNPEIIDHGVNGFLYNIEKPEEAIKFIEMLSGDSSLRKEIGMNARKYIEKTFALEVMGNSLKDIYQEVLN